MEIIWNLRDLMTSKRIRKEKSEIPCTLKRVETSNELRTLMPS